MIEIDPNIYIAVLKEQRNQALDAASIAQTKLIMLEKELAEKKPSLEAVK